MDMLLSTGEQVTISLLTMALQAKGYHAISLTGWQAGITTESVHSSARITDIHTDRIQSYLAEGTIVIVAGFHESVKILKLQRLDEAVLIQLLSH